MITSCHTSFSDSHIMSYIIKWSLHYVIHHSVIVTSCLTLLSDRYIMSYIINWSSHHVIHHSVIVTLYHTLLSDRYIMHSLLSEGHIMLSIFANVTPVSVMYQTCVKMWNTVIVLLVTMVKIKSFTLTGQPSWTPFARVFFFKSQTKAPNFTCRMQPSKPTLFTFLRSHKKVSHADTDTIMITKFPSVHTSP